MRPRPALAAAAAALVLGGVLAIPASAGAVGCAAFKTAVENASNGDTITLDAGLTCHGNYALPTNKTPLAVTIQGGGSGATLDGSGLPGPILDAIPNSGKQTYLAVRNLTFRNGNGAGDGGGAIAVVGGDTSATIDRSHFLHNIGGEGSNGGAVLIRSTTGKRLMSVTNSTFGDGTAAGANTASLAAGLDITAFDQGPSIAVTGNRFNRNNADDAAGGFEAFASAPGATTTVTGNVVTRNTAVLGAGGFEAGGPNVTLTGNRVLANTVSAPAGMSPSGAGASLFAPIEGGSLVQRDNLFDRNTMVQANPTSTFPGRGGGEYVSGFTFVSRRDRFTRNSIPPPGGAGESEGAGLFVSGCNAEVRTARLEGDVVAGNTAAPGAEAAGVYGGGCAAGPVQLTVLDSTIAGNSAPADASSGALDGGPADTLVLRNSIVAGNRGFDLTGFKTRTVTHSDVCDPAVVPGAGNICAPPRLRAPAVGNVRQTALSPTIGRGSNAEVAPGLTRDVDGDPRILGAHVDMGADEFRPRDDPFRRARLIARQTVTVKHRIARVRVRCPKTVPGPCRGRVSLSVVVRDKHGKRHRIGIGSHAFSIARGHSKRVPVTLSHTGRQLLARTGKLRTRGHAVATDALGTHRVSSATVKLRSR